MVDLNSLIIFIFDSTFLAVALAIIDSHKGKKGKLVFLFLI